MTTKVEFLEIKTKSIYGSFKSKDKQFKLAANNYILAIPPRPLIKFLEKSNIKHAYGDHQSIKNWAYKSRYLTYITFAFHWNQKINLPKIWGFPSNQWGIIYIVYSDYMKFKHKDSAGNEGYLTDGSVQWMTAGKGVIHSEMPEQTDGLSRGFQLWLNLPKNLKMIEPSYNDIPAESIPKINIPGGYIKVICGEINRMKGPGRAHTGMLFYDISLSPGTVSYTQLTLPTTRIV